MGWRGSALYMGTLAALLCFEAAAAFNCYPFLPSHRPSRILKEPLQSPHGATLQGGTNFMSVGVAVVIGVAVVTLTVAHVFLGRVHLPK